MTLHAICFDLDDTLYDYQQYARAGLRQVARYLEHEAGIKVTAELQRLYFDESVTEGTFDVLLDRYELEEVTVEELVEQYHSSTSSLAPYPATESVLRALEDEVRIGLVTDGREGHAKLDRLGIGEYFDSVLVTPTIDRSKHDPTVFDQVLGELSVGPAETAYVGDDPRVDFRVPNRLGMTTVRLRRGRYEDMEPPDRDSSPVHEVDSLGGVLEVVRT